MCHAHLLFSPPTKLKVRHKAGLQANRFVLEYGLRLLPQLHEVYNPMPCVAAREMEVELAIGLREAGYAVRQAQDARPGR